MHTHTIYVKIGLENVHNEYIALPKIITKPSTFEPHKERILKISIITSSPQNDFRCGLKCVQGIKWARFACTARTLW